MVDGEPLGRERTLGRQHIQQISRGNRDEHTLTRRVVERRIGQYHPSARPYPSKLPVPEYPGHFLVKCVADAGTFRFQQRLVYIANALVDQQIGLEETDDGVWAIYFNTVLIATLDERDYIIRG